MTIKRFLFNKKLILVLGALLDLFNIDAQNTLVGQYHTYTNYEGEVSYLPNCLGKCRSYSLNFQNNGICEFIQRFDSVDIPPNWREYSEIYNYEIDASGEIYFSSKKLSSEKGRIYLPDSIINQSDYFNRKKITDSTYYCKNCLQIDKSPDYDNKIYAFFYNLSKSYSICRKGLIFVAFDFFDGCWNIKSAIVFSQDNGMSDLFFVKKTSRRKNRKIKKIFRPERYQIVESDKGYFFIPLE